MEPKKNEGAALQKCNQDSDDKTTNEMKSKNSRIGDVIGSTIIERENDIKYRFDRGTCDVCLRIGLRRATNLDERLNICPVCSKHDIILVKQCATLMCKVRNWIHCCICKKSVSNGKFHYMGAIRFCRECVYKRKMYV